jgi:hypothetical protein
MSFWRTCLQLADLAFGASIAIGLGMGVASLVIIAAGLVR